MNQNSIIPPEQQGFQPGKSTVHQLKRLKEHIQANLRSGSSTGMLLLDIERAFDRVWHGGLLVKLIEYEFDPYLIHLIQSFLTNRQFHVTVERKSSTDYGIPFGVPQGSVLSPVLYNLFIADSPTNTTANRAFYADDTAFFTSSPYRAEITANLRTTFDTYQDFFRQWKISVNPTKTQAVFFTYRHTREIPRRPLRVRNSYIDWTESAKYLGMYLDKRMTFKTHVEYVLEKTEKALRLLYPLISRKSRLATNIKLLLYKMVLRPIFTYGAPVLSSIAKTHINKLQIQQNKILRMCLDAEYTTRISQLHDNSDIPMVLEFINNITDRFNAI